MTRILFILVAFLSICTFPALTQANGETEEGITLRACEVDGSYYWLNITPLGGTDFRIQNFGEETWEDEWHHEEGGVPNEEYVDSTIKAAKKETSQQLFKRICEPSAYKDGYKKIGSTIYIPGKSAGDNKWYMYKINLFIDETGHPLTNCPEISKKRHLNIKICRKKKNTTYEPYSDLHIAAKDKCNIILHDTLRNVRCWPPVNICDSGMNLAKAIQYAIHSPRLAEEIANTILPELEGMGAAAATYPEITLLLIALGILLL